MQASNFRADPYGWLTNQTSHMGLGVIWAMLACAAVLVTFDQFPYRVAVWSMILLLYLGVVELAWQGWRGADTVEDTIFVVGYGAGGLLYTMHETQPGTGNFTGNIWHVLPFVGVAAFHLAVGYAVRVYQSRQLQRGGTTHSERAK